MKDKGNKQQSEIWKYQRIAELEKELGNGFLVVPS